MTKALITHSYFYPLDVKQWKFKQPYPPLGSLLAASIARSAGLDVSLWDSNLESGPSRFFPVLEQENPRYVIVYDDGFNYLTKMCLTTMREASFAMIARAKEQGRIVIVSSSDAADHYDKYIDHGADFVIKGEGEDTLKELLDALENEVDFSSIQGLIFRQADSVKINPPRHVMRDLDQLPMPAWDLVDIESYRDIWLRHHGYFSLNIATTRGCPFKCNWCAKPIYGNRYNSRSPENVVAEINMLVKRYQPDHFWMCDDIFGLKPGWVQRFSQLLTEKHLRIRYKIQSRVDLLLKEDTIKALAQSGAETVWVGAESGSQKILDAMDKETTIAQISECTSLLKKHGIRVAFFLQFGYLGETREDIDKTIDMVTKLMPDEIGISVSYPLPGTVFYENVKSQMKDKQNWKDSDDLAMMFRSTFSSDYYKLLHRLVHSIYRKHKGYHSFRKFLGQPFSLNGSEIRAVLKTFYYMPKAFLQQRKLKQLEITVFE